jgi:hypothetical protein
VIPICGLRAPRSPGDWGRGFAGCLAGRAAIRSKIGIGIGNGVFGMGVVSWLAGCVGQGRQGMGVGCGRGVLDFHSLEITALQKATD